MQRRTCLSCPGYRSLAQAASRSERRRSDNSKMSVSKVQVGQVWKKAGSDESFLVTRLYSEALATFAVLRPAGKENAAILRIKVVRKGTGQAIPGFSMAQDSDEF